jgi:release factor glutamine methyltransferase
MVKCFYGKIGLEVPAGVYEPREDSVLAADYLSKTKVKRALEIGCGSGLLSILLAKNGADVTAVDINPVAVEATKANAKANGTKIEAFVSDLFSKVKGKFGLIVFNAPYLREETSEGSEAWAAGEGLEIIKRFILGAPKYLEKDAYIIMLISSLTGKEEVLGMFAKAGLKAKAVAEKKVAWESLLLIEARF